MLAIPAHTSHKIQPLDNVSFANFKKFWNENLQEYLLTSVGCRMPKMDFSQVFWPTWIKAMTVANIQAGYRQTGIYPVNPSAKNLALPGLSQATNSIASQGKENSCHMLCFSY